MKILVLSDSHSGYSFMRYCIEKLCPQHVIHLGDHYDDAIVMAEEFPHIRFHHVPGNCDFSCRGPGFVDTMCYSIEGVKIFMTHGHKQGVKSGIERLLTESSQHAPQAVLFGHTHEALCFQQADGIWVMNPGSCRSWSGSVGLIELTDGTISACQILRQADID